MAVERTWRSVDRRFLIDEVVDEPGVAYRLWDAEGLPLADVSGPGELGRILAEYGIDQAALEQVPTDDPWCE